MATTAHVLPPPAPVAQEAVVQQENAADAPFASAEPPSLRIYALDEAMPDADAAAAREQEAIKKPVQAPASAPQRDGTSTSAAADCAEPHIQPAEPAALTPAPTPMDADPPPPAGTSSAPGPAPEKAASAAAPDGPAAKQNGVSATARITAAPVVKAPAPSAAVPMMNGTAKANGSSSAAGPAAKPPAAKAPAAAAADSDSEDDVPLARRIVTPPSKPAKPASAGGEKKKRPLENGAAKPAAKKARPEAPRQPKQEAKTAKQKQPKPQDDLRSRERRREDAPKRKADRSGSRARASGDDNGGQSAKSENREKKWDTLEHAGILFPPEYEPHGVCMLYEGKPVELNAEQEELATMIAVMKETDYMKKPTFLKNAWAAFKEVLGKGHTIRGLEKCDFTPIYEHYMAKKEADKARSKEDKLAAKEEKQAKEKKYTFALVDGRQEQVGNFRVEPPGLFRGRGEHPKMGKYKRRIYPRDVTINVGKGVHIEVPEPYRSQGQKWKEVRHDNTVTWLAYWKDPVNDSQYKYVWLAANSTFKSDSDLAKYEKARKLKDYIGPIRTAYEKDWASASVASQQMAVALYFIDVLALRAGHEKEEDEADTVGCCTLKVENVECIEPASIKFDFLGKDSVPYENTVEVKPLVFRNVRRWIKKDAGGANKRPGDQLFDTFDANDLNKRLRELMDGLSAKVFRTYNASVTLDRLLWSNEDGTPSDGIAADGTVDAKKASYDRANKEVAILCNHQKSVGKGHEGAMEKLQDKLKDAKHHLKDLHSSGGSDAKIAAKQKQIARLELSAKVKEDLKNVALGTSKINYMDPRITVAWCKRNEVPMEKTFNKSLLSKFAWAMDVEPQFRF